MVDFVRRHEHGRGVDLGVIRRRLHGRGASGALSYVVSAWVVYSNEDVLLASFNLPGIFRAVRNSTWDRNCAEHIKTIMVIVAFQQVP